MRSTKIQPVDDVPVWSIICLVVRGGHRRQGVTRHLVEGAVAFVGTRAMFERAGFEVIGTTDAVASKMPRLVMRRTLVGA